MPMWRPQGTRVDASQVSREYIDAFTRRLDAVNEAAGKVIVTETARMRLAENLDFYRRMDDITFENVMEMLDRTCNGATRLSSALACEFYDGIRSGAVLEDGFRAELWDGYDSDRIRGAAYKIMEEVQNGTNTAPLSSLLTDVASREVNNAANETVRRNAKRDPAKPKCASVPTASNPCEWCRMRASAGFIYDQDSGSHNNCKCRLVPGFKGAEKVEGYDPAPYREEWDEAAAAYRSGDIDDDLKEQIAEAEARHAQELAEGRASKPWDETNAILMVMRRM